MTPEVEFSSPFLNIYFFNNEYSIGAQHLGLEEDKYNNKILCDYSLPLKYLGLVVVIVFSDCDV